LEKKKERRIQKSLRGFASASPPPRRPRRTKNKSGIQYWRRKKKEEYKKACGASRLQAHLPAVRAGQRINQVFYIGEEKRKKARKKENFT